MRTGDNGRHFLLQFLAYGIHDTRYLCAFLRMKKRGEAHPVQRFDSGIVGVVKIVLLQYVQNDLIATKADVGVLHLVILRTVLRDEDELIQVFQIGIKGKLARIEQVLIRVFF